MKLIVPIIFIIQLSWCFNQSHQQTIDSLFAINKFHEASIYIENAGLKKTPGYRYYYFEARRRSDLVRSFDEDILMEELFRGDYSSNEYFLTKWTMSFYSDYPWDPPIYEYDDYLEEREDKPEFKAEIFKIMAVSEMFSEGGQITRAKLFIDSCIQLKPNLKSVNVLKYLVEKRIRNGVPDTMFNETKTYLDREKELYPLNPGIAYALRRYHNQDSDEKRQDVYLWAHQSSPQESRYLGFYLEAIGKSKAKAFLKKNVKFQHSRLVFEIYKEYGLNEERKYTAKKLIKHNLSYLKKDSNDFCAMHDIIEPYFELEEYQKATFYGEKLRKAGMASNDNLQFLAKAYYNLGEYNNALQVCLDELNKNSRTTGFYTIAADVFIQKKQYEKAFRYLRVGEDKTDLNGYFTEARHYAILFEHCFRNEKYRSNAESQLGLLGKGCDDETACIYIYYHNKFYPKKEYPKAKKFRIEKDCQKVIDRILIEIAPIFGKESE